jgi:hypothetical protein
MLSFFSRYTKPNTYYYNTNLSRYIIDTTNKIKESYTNTKPNTYDIIIQDPYEYSKCDCDYSIVPIFSMISFLAGYYLSKYNN